MPAARAALASLVCVGLLAAGCASAPYDPAVLSDEAVVLPLPVVRQDELYQCGLAAVSSLCAYHGVEVPDRVRAALVETAEREGGLSGAELRDALEGLGFEAWIFAGTLDRGETGLLRHLDAGRPLLVMTVEPWSSPHYVLAAGYDPARSLVYVLDPRRGPVAWPEAAFRSAWERSMRFTLLATPAADPDGPPSATSSPPSAEPSP